MTTPRLPAVGASASLLVLLVMLVAVAQPVAAPRAQPAPAAGSIAGRSAAVLDALRRTTCDAMDRAAVPGNAVWHAECRPQPRPVAVRLMPTGYHAVSVQPPDGSLLARQRIAATSQVALDIVSYASDGLVVGGLLCYPNDGQRHSTVIHVHGGLGGVFQNAAGDLVQTCIDWAALHGRTAFAPSFRGQDGGEGQAELCLGEADDLVNGAIMVRGLEATDPGRVAVVGGSIGACVVLRAAPRIPNLAAVVAFVPPVSWKDLVQYHRTAWAPRTETRCDNSTQDWNIGGPAFADALDSVICGHANCSDADYVARSPLQYVTAQSAPTLVVAAEDDNIVPFSNQVLWSIMRQNAGHPVNVIPIDPCDLPGTPPPAFDQLLFTRHSFHLLAPGPISSGMLFLMDRLDAIPAAASAAGSPALKTLPLKTVAFCGLH